MERKIVNDLLKWKNNPDKQPLILQGARQVGKTYILLSFGKQYYKNVAYFSMEESKDIPAIFERDLNPERIIKELAVHSGQSIFPEDTLIIFDEIQACEQALTSLKYFAEKAPQYHIIAAGSLLGVAMKRKKFSFPVGKVDMLYLYPMDFEEFLWAVDRRDFCDLIKEACENFTHFTLHEAALFLDINPDSKAALKHFNHFLPLAREASEDFEKRYGPLSHASKVNTERWKWTDGPWPWEYQGGGV